MSVQAPPPMQADNPAGMAPVPPASIEHAAQASVLQLFHPAVAGWFARTFPAPTEAQVQAWPSIEGGRNTLVGPGKVDLRFIDQTRVDVPHMSDLQAVAGTHAFTLDRRQRRRDECTERIDHEILIVNVPGEDRVMIIRDKVEPK